MEGKLSYTRRVQYYETDKMAIVHHANYIRWMEEARLDCMSRAGIDYAQMEAAGILMPVTSVSCEYKTPMRFGQTAEILVALTVFNGVRCGYEYEIVCVETGKTAARGTSGHCFIDERTRRPLNLKKRHPIFYERGARLLAARRPDEEEHHG